MTTFKELEQVANEKNALRLAIFNDEEAQRAKAEERKGWEYWADTIDFFVIGQGLVQVEAEKAITVKQRNGRWGNYYWAVFNIPGHITIQARMIRKESGQILFEDTKDLWVVKDDRHSEATATLGEALLLSAKIQKKNDKWIAEAERHENLEELAYQEEQDLATLQRAEQMDAWIEQVEMFLANHPEAWKAITILMLYYEVTNG